MSSFTWRDSGYTKRKNLIRNRFGVPSSSNISNSIYDFDNSKWIKLITRLRLCLSHLQEHKFEHSFQRLTPYATGAMSTVPSLSMKDALSWVLYLLHKFLENLNTILKQTLLFGNTSFNANENTRNFNATISFIFSTKRFDELLFELVIDCVYWPNKKWNNKK